MKTCFSCKYPRSEAEFSLNKSKPDGLNHICKECKRKKDNEHYRAKTNGEKVYKPQLTDQQKQEIIEAHSVAPKTKEIAQKYGVRASTIRRIVKGKTKSVIEIRKSSTEEIAKIIELRTKYKKFDKEIAEELSINERHVGYVLSKAGVKLSRYEMRANPNRADILKERHGSLTPIKDLAEKYDMTASGVKSLLRSVGATIPMEARQQNAMDAKLAKNPDAIKEMQERSHTPEANAKRSATNTIVYQNPDLRLQKSQQSRNWWAGLNEQDKAEYLKNRQMAIENSPDVKKYQQRQVGDTNSYSQSIVEKFGVDNMAAYYGQMAENKGGGLLEYSGSHEKALWECSDGHMWEALPNSIQQGSWCGKCSFTGVSQAELDLYEFVKKHYPDALHDKNVITSLKKARIDVYVPSLKKAIELDGAYWHGFETAKQRDLRKNEACIKDGIQLKRIVWEEYVKDVDKFNSEILEWLKS